MSDYELIRKLKPWVTNFSEGLRLQHKHGDEVCIGGKVVNIFDFDALLQEEPEDHAVHIEVDDEVGEMTLFVPNKLFDELKERHGLKIGEEIIAVGKVFDPRGEMKEGKAKPRVGCWKVEPLASKIKEGEA